MDILTDEHRMLQDSLDSILSTATDPAQIWSQLAHLGMLGLTLSERAGGAGLGLPELLLFARRLGRAGVASPFFAAEILTMPLLANLANEPAVVPLLADLLKGSRIATLALNDLEPVKVRASAAGGLRLNGQKTRVPAASVADILVASAVSNGRPALILLDLAAPGLTRTPYQPAGPSAAADIAFEDMALSKEALLIEGEGAAAMINEAQARGQLAICAEMLGGMEVLMDLTLDYLRTRHQFDKPLAAFQALQHAAVDMYVELETARAMFDYGSSMFGATLVQRSQVLDALKLKMNEAARIIGESAVQLHGGIGMTEESMTGRIFAQLTARRLAYGDSRICMNRLLANDASIALN